MKTGRPTFVGKEIKSSDQFPVGLRVLVVDNDSTCLQGLEQMLQACGYQVTKCLRAKDALSILREGRNKFDIVISDVHMPDMDGFKLLKIICLEMDLPVVMMSADDENEIVMKGIIDGACDYLVKPVRMEAVKFIWKHVVRKSLKAFEQLKNVNGSEVHQQQLNINVESRVSSMDEGNYGSSTCVKAEEDEVRDDLVSMKKPRMVWTPELHQQFIAAVNQIGLKNAVPKKILEVMNVVGLTRENVASHLQKYRLYLRREEETLQQQCNKFTKLPIRDQERSLEHDGGYNLQCQMITSAQPPSLPLQQRSNAVVFSNGTSPLCNQTSNSYNCGIPESVYGMGDSTVIESNHIHLTPLNKFGQVYGNVGLQINQGTPEDRFSRNWTGSFTMERPSKLQKLNENASNKETFKDETICYPVSFSHIPTDFPKGLNQFSGHGFSPNNCGGNACYVDDHGIALCASDSSYDLPAHSVQRFEKDDFNVKPYDEQFVGSAGVKFSFDGYPENNSVQEKF